MQWDGDGEEPSGVLRADAAVTGVAVAVVVVVAVVVLVLFSFLQIRIIKYVTCHTARFPEDRRERVSRLPCTCAVRMRCKEANCLHHSSLLSVERHPISTIRVAFKVKTVAAQQVVNAADGSSQALCTARFLETAVSASAGSPAPALCACGARKPTACTTTTQLSVGRSQALL